VSVEIAFITVNFNTLDQLTRLADFFRALRVPFTFSFTVVDNNSQDGSQEFLRSRPDINYLQTGENLGYGRAINRGVAATASKYVCVMNTDVILNAEALTALWRFMEDNPQAGVSAPRLVYSDGRTQGMIFQPSLLAHYWTGYAKVLAWWAKRKLRGDPPVRVDGVLGAFFVVRRSTITPLLFDEDFFFFHEDTALAHSWKNRGILCFVLPSSTIIHIGGKSRSVAAVKFFYESKYLYLAKFYSSFHARTVFKLDRFRMFRKWLLYSLLFRLSHSERLRHKQEHYRLAWLTVRPQF